MASSWTLMRRRLPRPILVIALLCGQACRDAADESATNSATSQPRPVRREASKGPLRVVVEADRDSVEVPERVALELTVQAELGVDVRMPDIAELVGAFEVKEIEKADPVQDDLHQTLRWTLQLSPLLAGPWEIPPLSIAYTDARPRADPGAPGPTSISDSIETPPLPVSVEQALADVKGPAIIEIARSYRLILWIAAAVAAMIAAALFARWFNRRRRLGEAALPERRVPPHVWALQELDRLIAENLVARGRVQEFYFRINALLRRYIELRFGIMAGEQTSEEFLRDLQQSPLLVHAHKEGLQRFVSACDPVKYARYQPRRDEIDWVQSAARDMILQTAETSDPSSRTADVGSEVAA
jgi:hypothetical protein